MLRDGQVIPPMEEKEMTKIFLKTLGPFYYEKMIASALVDFTEMVGMGVRLEEAVREGRLVQNDSVSSIVKKYGSSFQKKNESDANAISHGRNSLSKGKASHQPQQVASVASIVNSAHVAQA